MFFSLKALDDYNPNSFYLLKFLGLIVMMVLVIVFLICFERDPKIPKEFGED